MKFLLIPKNNSLSHVAKCLALEDRLTALGHDALVAVSGKSAHFLRGLGRQCAVLPDIQENDDAGFPTVQWFNKPHKIAECIKAEVALLKEYRPDRVLGVFRFTAGASAALAGIPFDSLTCGCMLRTTDEVLGFAAGDQGAQQQAAHLDLFYQYAAARFSAVIKEFGLSPIADIRETLHGERTFLWDFPEFAPVAPDPAIHHVGPLSWRQWPCDEIDLDKLTGQSRPLAVVTFGTCVNSVGIATRTVRMLVELGYHVLLAAGGQSELVSAINRHPRVTVCRFAPLHLIFPHTSLLVCHGGQMTLFEAMAQRIPVLVMPLQPEQAHNGLCIERLGCGRKVIPPRQFRGASNVYIDAFNALSDDDFSAMAAECASSIRTSGRLERTAQQLARFDGLETLCRHLVS